MDGKIAINDSMPDDLKAAIEFVNTQSFNEDVDPEADIDLPDEGFAASEVEDYDDDDTEDVDVDSEETKFIDIDEDDDVSDLDSMF